MIICQNLFKTFKHGDTQALAVDDLSLEVEEGEVVIISGPPSSGKTTLLSMLAGFVHPDEGSIHILVKEITKLSPEEMRSFRQENLGIHLQTISLFSSLSVLDNILIPLHLTKISKKARLPRAFSVLEQMGLMSKKDKLIRELSQGERSLVLLARALVLEPKVLILDEPTLLLDHSTSVKIMTFLRERALDHQTIVIAAIGDTRLYPFANRLVRVKQGQIADITGEVVKEIPPPPYLRI